jgi:hypothetical protein
MRTTNLLRFITGFALIMAPLGAGAAPFDTLLPLPACSEGWQLEGKTTRYDRDTLFERINGEAELFFPYGFDQLVTGRYTGGGDGRTALEIDVYRMGSLLDAYGMYANYRGKDEAAVAIGVEGILSPSQLFFYQDRYLVRLQATGAGVPGREVFLACGAAVARNLPAGNAPPQELATFRIPELVPRSDRYVAQSLLGYDFFRRGLVADLAPDGGETRLFMVPEESPKQARLVFTSYRAYLNGSGKGFPVVETPEFIRLEAPDPLYGAVIVEQAGRFVLGAIRVKDAVAARRILEQLRQRLKVLR